MHRSPKRVPFGASSIDGGAAEIVPCLPGGGCQNKALQMPAVEAAAMNCGESIVWILAPGRLRHPASSRLPRGMAAFRRRLLGRAGRGHGRRRNPKTQERTERQEVEGNPEGEVHQRVRGGDAHCAGHGYVQDVARQASPPRTRSRRAAAQVQAPRGPRRRGRIRRRTQRSRFRVHEHLAANDRRVGGEDHAEGVGPDADDRVVGGMRRLSRQVSNRIGPAPERSARRGWRRAPGTPGCGGPERDGGRGQDRERERAGHESTAPDGGQDIAAMPAA